MNLILRQFQINKEPQSRFHIPASTYPISGSQTHSIIFIVSKIEIIE